LASAITAAGGNAGSITDLQLRLLALSAHYGRVESWAAIGNVYFDMAKSKKTRRAAAITTIAPTTRSMDDGGFVGILQSFISSIVSVSVSVFIPFQELTADELCGGEDIDIPRSDSCHEVLRSSTSDAVLVSSLDSREAEAQSRVLAATSVWYYSKGSAAGDALASLYAGMMTHLGIGAPRSSIRAQRYYALALRQSTELNKLHPQLRSLTKLLLWYATATQDGHVLKNFMLPFERIAKYAFDV
jgi:hypothetical protein